MCALHEKSHLAWPFYSQVEVISRLALTLYFESLYFSGFERKESEREIVYMYSFLRKKSLFGEGVFMGVLSL